MRKFLKIKIFRRIFGQNVAFELKVNSILRIGNRLSFPYFPSKSQYYLYDYRDNRSKTTKAKIANRSAMISFSGFVGELSLIFYDI